MTETTPVLSPSSTVAFTVVAVVAVLTDVLVLVVLVVVVVLRTTSSPHTVFDIEPGEFVNISGPGAEEWTQLTPQRV